MTNNLQVGLTSRLGIINVFVMKIATRKDMAAIISSMISIKNFALLLLLSL